MIVRRDLRKHSSCIVLSWAITFKCLILLITYDVVKSPIHVGMEMQAMGPNHYALLNVSRNSNPLEIKRAYKKLSLQLHPDKNPNDPDASAKFDRVKKAYDILMDMEFREVYNKFGQNGINSNKRYDETQFFMELAVFYVTWGIMAYVLTLGARSGLARQWTFTGLIVMLVIEISIMTARGNPFPSWFMPQNTEYEAIWLLHTLFPAFMNGCRSIGSYLYVDLEAQTRQLLVALQEQNKDILLVLRDIQIGMQHIQANGGGGSRSTAGVPVAGTTGITPTAAIRDLQDRIAAGNTRLLPPGKPMIMPPFNGGSLKEKTSSNYGFYLMILGYIALSYIFNKN